MKTLIVLVLFALGLEAKQKTWCIEGCNITAKIEPDLCVLNCKWDHPRRPVKTVLDIFQDGLKARFTVREINNYTLTRAEHWFSVQNWGEATPLEIYRQVINGSQGCAMSDVTVSKIKSAAQTVIDQVREEKHREKARRIGWIIPVSFVGFVGICLLCAIMAMPP